MTPASLAQLVSDYLAARRGLGFQLDTPEWLLGDFARYADQTGHQGPVRIELAVRWALLTRSEDPAQAVRRLAGCASVRALAGSL